jgi:medium-chain acyl-[acyl-carrier-protein] hydrolase
MNPQRLVSTKASLLWFPNAGSNRQAKLRLFCFPYAGGSSAVFHDWGHYVPPEIDVVPVHLPGRGTRLLEKARVRMEPLVQELKEAIEPLLDLPYVFFGHSMGAILCFELARSLRRAGKSLPQQLFVSARCAPQILNSDPPSYLLPDRELVQEIERLNGTPREIIHNKEIMDFVLPLVRADFELIHSYKYHDDAVLSCGISAYAGLDDPEVTLKEITEWREQTSSSFNVRTFKGDHFFLISRQAALLNVFSKELSLILEANSPYVASRTAY